jgi:hypothetical protein
MPKTKKHYKKRKTIRKRKTIGGSGFTDKIRGKTRRVTPERERRRTITPNDRNRFNRSNRTYVPSQEERKFIATPPKPTTRRESPPKFRDNGYMVDPNYGLNESAFYSGPSIIRGEKGIPHGKDGMIAYSTGHIYEGDFNKGKREGTGTLRMEKGPGPSYTGEWKDDKFVPFTEWKSQR